MKTLTTLFLTALSSVMLAQIPDAGFENWTGGTPNGWYDLNSIYPGGSLQSSNFHTGASSLELDASNAVGGHRYGGFVETGSLGSPYFPTGVGTTPAALTGWYELNPVAGDELEIAVITIHGGAINGGGNLKDTGSVAIWKQFTLCITASSTADSASIFFDLLNSSGRDTIHNGTTAFIDDIAWGACTAGIDNINNDVTLEPSYPNPANNICNIIFSLPGTSTVSVALYDLNGRKMMGLMDNTNLTSGRYKIPVDVRTLANGVYFYTILVDGVPYTQKLVVTK